MKLASLFSTGAVLQRDHFIPIWGECSPNAVVHAELAGREAFVPASASGRFMLRLPPLKAGGPYELRVTDLTTQESLSVPDVLIGEVWIAAGQSNMAYALFRADETALTGKPSQYDDFVAGLQDPATLRMLTVPVCYSGALEDGIRAEWLPATPDNVRKFSAVALWFAHEIRAQLDVPVGIITSAVGGSCIESWMSRTAFLNDPVLRRGLAAYDAFLTDPDLWHDPDAGTHGAPEPIRRWADTTLDDTGWQEMQVPGSWIRQGIGRDGAIWARRAVEIPPSWAGRDLVLLIGAVDKCDVTYFDGVEVGRTGRGFDTGHWNTPRRYAIPGRLVKAGIHVIAVHAYSFCFDGAIHGTAAEFALSRADTGESLPLAGVWKARAEYDFGLTTAPSILFNGMLHPLIPYAIRGALWYQGESNADRLEDALAYETRLKGMIEDWRALWGQGNFPFLMVQLAGFGAKQEFQPDHPWPPLRDAQRRVAAALPHVGMAVALDAGDVKDIHPADKRTVGLRLARIALHETYHQPNIVPCGPMYREAVPEGGRLRIRFDYADGLQAKGGGPLKGFFLAGADQRFYPATAVIEGTSVVLTAEQVTQAYAAHYAWAAYAEANLYNGEELPASPFSTIGGLACGEP